MSFTVVFEGVRVVSTSAEGIALSAASKTSNIWSRFRSVISCSSFSFDEDMLILLTLVRCVFLLLFALLLKGGKEEEENVPGSLNEEF